MTLITFAPRRKHNFFFFFFTFCYCFANRERFKKKKKLHCHNNPDVAESRSVHVCGTVSAFSLFPNAPVLRKIFKTKNSSYRRQRYRASIPLPTRSSLYCGYASVTTKRTVDKIRINWKDQRLIANRVVSVRTRTT